MLQMGCLNDGVLTTPCCWVSPRQPAWCTHPPACLQPAAPISVPLPTSPSPPPSLPSTLIPLFPSWVPHMRGNHGVVYFTLRSGLRFHPSSCKGRTVLLFHSRLIRVCTRIMCSVSIPPGPSSYADPTACIDSKLTKTDQGCSSVAEDLSRMHNALDSIPASPKMRNK